jgi:hypothetical protein
VTGSLCCFKTALDDFLYLEDVDELLLRKSLQALATVFHRHLHEALLLLSNYFLLLLSQFGISLLLDFAQPELEHDAPFALELAFCAQVDRGERARSHSGLFSLLGQRRHQ